MSEDQEEQGFESLKDQFKNQEKELELPKFIDGNRVQDLRERKTKTVDEINRIMKGIPKGRKAGDKIVFSTSTTAPEQTRKVGEHWTDAEGREWIQHKGWRERVPKINRKELEALGALVPWSCPKCSKPMSHWLDKKMWPIHKMCYDCVAEIETEMQIKGTYKDYENQRIMANIRSWYNEVVNSIDDYVKSFHGDYVNSFGDVEKWGGGITDEQIRDRLNKDLSELRESFEREFGEPLLLEKGNADGTVDKQST